MQFTTHSLIGASAELPINDAVPVISLSPVVLPAPNRKFDLELRISFPSTGAGVLPIILLSHGHGLSNYLSSLEGYTPLADFWAGHGFVVIQPTHLSSKSLGIALDGDNIREIFLDSRATDMSFLLDHLDDVEVAVPLLKGRLDKSKIAVAGHSLGGLTASVLLGATNTDPRDGAVTKLADPRIKAGVVFGGTGNGGADLSDNGKKMLPFYGIDFSSMRTPTLVAWGDEDVGPHLTVRGADWHKDPYTYSPGPKGSLMVKGGKHGFGGISGWDAGETLDESPERLEMVRRMSWAYLRSQLNEQDTTWDEACKVLQDLGNLGQVENKS